MTSLYSEKYITFDSNPKEKYVLKPGVEKVIEFLTQKYDETKDRSILDTIKDNLVFSPSEIRKIKRMKIRSLFNMTDDNVSLSEESEQFLSNNLLDILLKIKNGEFSDVPSDLSREEYLVLPSFRNRLKKVFDNPKFYESLNLIYLAVLPRSIIEKGQGSFKFKFNDYITSIDFCVIVDSPKQFKNDYEAEFYSSIRENLEEFNKKNISKVIQQYEEALVKFPNCRSE